MATLSQAQVEMYARAAGMPNPPLMAAIAMAESGGRTTAHNALPPDDSYGLWQINMLGAMGPARRREFGISKNSDLYDPAVNARAAARILSSQGLKAWSTYTNGAYKKHLKSGAQPADWDIPIPGLPHVPDSLGPDWLTPDLGDIPGLPGGDASLADAAEGIGAVAEAVQKAGEWMSQSSNWVRIAYVWGGGVLVLISVYSLASPLIGKAALSSPMGQVVKKTAGSLKAPAPRKTAAKAAPKKGGTK